MRDFVGVKCFSTGNEREKNAWRTSSLLEDPFGVCVRVCVFVCLVVWSHLALSSRSSTIREGGGGGRL